MCLDDEKGPWLELGMDWCWCVSGCTRRAVRVRAFVTSFRVLFLLREKRKKSFWFAISCTDIFMLRFATVGIHANHGRERCGSLTADAASTLSLRVNGFLVRSSRYSAC